RAWGASAVVEVIGTKGRSQRLHRAAFALTALAFHVGLVGGFVGLGGCLGGVLGLHFVGVDEAVAVAVVRGEPAAVAVVGGGEFGLGQLAVLFGVHLRHAAFAFTALALVRGLLGARGGVLRAEHVALRQRRG